MKTVTDEYIEGDFITDDDVEFLNDVEITGSFKAKSCHAHKSIHVHKDYEVSGDDCVDHNQYVSKNQHVIGDQHVGMDQYVGGRQDVRVYINRSFKPIDLKKVKTKRILFCSTERQERNFWSETFRNIPELSAAIADGYNCFDEILDVAIKYKNEILETYMLPAVRQAVELWLENAND